MIYMAPCVNVFDACRYITRASRRGLGNGNREFLGPVKWHRVDRRGPFGAQKTRDFPCNVEGGGHPLWLLAFIQLITTWSNSAAETLKRWPLPTVETESKGDSRKGVLPWLVRRASRAGTRDFCPALAALVGPIVHYFTSLVPIAQPANRAASPVSY